MKKLMKNKTLKRLTVVGQQSESYSPNLDSQNSLNNSRIKLTKQYSNIMWENHFSENGNHYVFSHLLITCHSFDLSRAFMPKTDPLS